ncbi:MAG: superoxide dismutase [Deltaproteobacteria bacterium CG11_big_fil_rev_8_21_14_0_20_47_16]|nr:MAG: superoxide dismutase [Deltaproteobacteria bacterium CG11_big_fil_rev_8_21_14_0_20_47_16]
MFTLPKLTYDFDALEPTIDARTMEIHHDKHHAAYVANLNKALEGDATWNGKALEDILTHLGDVPEKIRTAVRNNGGGHWNHSLYWQVMGPNCGGEPTGKLADAIKASFGSFADFKTQFQTAGAGRFGSGWVWLVKDASGKLSIMSTPNQDNPLMEGKTAILGNDVWEHAYYLNYQNRRPDYLAAWWNVVDWKRVGELFDGATWKCS